MELNLIGMKLFILWWVGRNAKRLVFIRVLLCILIARGNIFLFLMKKLCDVNVEKSGLNIYFYDFSVYYDSIAVSDMLDIRKYLMKKHDIN